MTALASPGFYVERKKLISLLTFREGCEGFISEFYLSGFIIEIFSLQGPRGTKGSAGVSGKPGVPVSSF